jgi:hypothetical protein
MNIENSIVVAKIDFAWFAEDYRTQNAVESWREYATEGDGADVGAWLEYATEAAYDDHIQDVMAAAAEEFEWYGRRGSW